MKKNILKPPFLKKLTFIKDSSLNSKEFPMNFPIFSNDFTLEFKTTITIFVGDFFEKGLERKNFKQIKNIFKL